MLSEIEKLCGDLTCYDTGKLIIDKAYAPGYPKILNIYINILLTDGTNNIVWGHDTFVANNFNDLKKNMIEIFNKYQDYVVNKTTAYYTLNSVVIGHRPINIYSFKIINEHELKMRLYDENITLEFVYR